MASKSVTCIDFHAMKVWSFVLLIINFVGVAIGRVAIGVSMSG